MAIISHVPGELIIIFKSGITFQEIKAFANEQGFKVLAKLPAMRNSSTCLLEVPKGSENELSNKLRNHPYIESVGPNRKAFIA
jgi:hypothetical protein